MARLFPLLCVLLLSLALAESARASEERLLCLHGPLSEIAVLLGRGHELVGADSTATWPTRLKDLPSVGYVRNLNAEGVVSLLPSMILYDQSSGPPLVIQQLQALQQPLHFIETPGTLVGIPERIRAVGRALDRVEEGEALATAAAADLAAAAGMGLGPDGKRERALFVFHPRGTNLTAAGAGVVGHQLLEHVGLENILSKEQGWITLQAEAAVAAGPTVVVTTSSALAGIGGMDSLVNHPALAATPAGKNGRVIVLDTMSALGYGPRTGRAALRLAKALRPNADLPEPAIDAFIRGVGLSP